MFQKHRSPSLEDSQNFLQQAADLGTHIRTCSVVIQESFCFFLSALLVLFISSNAAFLEISSRSPSCVCFLYICWTLLQLSPEALPLMMLWTSGPRSPQLSTGLSVSIKSQLHAEKITYHLLAASARTNDCGVLSGSGGGELERSRAVSKEAKIKELVT